MHTLMYVIMYYYNTNEASIQYMNLINSDSFSFLIDKFVYDGNSYKNQIYHAKLVFINHGNSYLPKVLNHHQTLDDFFRPALGA